MESHWSLNGGRGNGGGDYESLCAMSEDPLYTEQNWEPPPQPPWEEEWQNFRKGLKLAFAISVPLLAALALLLWGLSVAFSQEPIDFTLPVRCIPELRTYFEQGSKERFIADAGRLQRGEAIYLDQTCLAVLIPDAEVRIPAGLAGRVNGWVYHRPDQVALALAGGAQDWLDALERGECISIPMDTKQSAKIVRVCPDG